MPQVLPNETRPAVSASASAIAALADVQIAM